MSGSDTKKSKKRKSNKSGNMGDVLGKECGDSEKEELQGETCGENVREEADGAPSGDDHSSQSSGEAETLDTKRPDETKADIGPAAENQAMSVIPTNAVPREEKPCNCDACKDRRELAAEQLEEMRKLQTYWMELRQYIRTVYRMAMEGRTPDSNSTEGNEANMKELVQKLCDRDPHQLFQRLESQVQEFVIEAKVRQLELLHREQQTPELAQIFLTGLLEGFEKLCLAARQLAPLLQQLETEHLQKFNLTWEVLNKHLYQSCVYTDPLVQTNLPVYIGQLRNMLPGKNEAYSELVHHYLAFDDEMTLIGAMWRDTEALVHNYNQEQATLKAKQRMLREDWELFRVQRKLIQQKMWNKTASELRELDEHLDSPREGSPGFCLGCSSRRGCPCDECAMTHLLTCGGLYTPVSPPGSPPSYNHKMEVVREYRVEGEGSEQPPGSPLEPDLEPALNAGDEPLDLSTSNQQQSCECHVCTAPLMTPVDLMENYECHTCVQQGVPLPGGSGSGNMNLHTGGFHLYPHIHGTGGGGGDTGSLYPHLYNIHPSLLTQLGTKHSRLGVHLPDQLQLAGSDPKAQHAISPPTSSVTDLIPLEALPPASSPSTAASTTAAGFSTPTPARPKTVVASPGSPAVSPPKKSPAPTAQKLSPQPQQPQPSQHQPPTLKLHPPKQLQKLASPTLHKQATATAGKVVSAPCREHAGLVAAKTLAQQNVQSSTSTQTSPNKALTQQKVSPAVSRQLAQNIMKRVPPGGQQPQTLMNGHHHPAAARSLPNIGTASSVRHSMTQTAASAAAGHGHAHPHNSLPDVVKSAATSTTPHRPPSSSGSKVATHSCHKTLKNGGSMEPIKRVACADYPDSEVVDMEDSSSQDDTCSERSSSTTTSTQRDSRHCDCCYCEVFGHGMPSVAPVSRNYQEMRERLRLLLTKKKAKCKVGPGNPGTVPPGATPPQPAPAGTQPSTPEAATAKPTVPSTTPPPSVAAAPATLTKQDSADSLPQPRDSRDLEALLDFIEGNQTGRCKNAKKAAKKARQKQKKLEEKERRDQEEAERLRGLEALQANTPEVTITVVNTPGATSVPNPAPAPLPASNPTTGKGGKGAKRVEPPPAPAVSTPATTNSSTPAAPQMVTIKRVMEPNGAEPTVTITLKGATPDKDKVLFTLVNGQGDYLCQSQEETKPGNQQANGPSLKNSANNNQPSNGKKKKNGKGNPNTQQNSVPVNNKSNHSNAKNVKNSTSNSASVPAPKAASNKSVQQMNSVLPAQVATPATRAPPATNRSFSLENLKLPPGITITKVDGPTAAAQKKSQLKVAENTKPPVSITPTNGSTTIIAAPTSMGNNRLPGYGPAVNGSNVIVVDTGRMKDMETAVMPSAKDHSEGNNQNSGNSKKKNKKKGKNENGPVNGVHNNTTHMNGNPKVQQRQQQMVNGVHTNGKQQQHVVNNKGQQNNATARSQSAPQQQQVPKQNGRAATANPVSSQSAIIKVNGSMVTIRNPALQQAMATSRYPPPVAMQLNGHGEAQEIAGKGNNHTKGGNKKNGGLTSPMVNGIVNTKGKENNSAPPPRFANADTNMLRNRLAQSECNGINGLPGLHVSKVMTPNGRPDERTNNSLPPRMRPLLQQVAPSNQKIVQNSNSMHQNHSHEPSLQHPNAARAVIQAQTAVREAMAAADAKKKKKKKKGAGGQGHADDWTLVESVFAPKDIDLENGDIDDDERELEAFKRFCFNSVPPKRKEKVHLNIKDIVLKKKSSAIGCS